MTKLNETARGVFVISATPFTQDGALDLDSTDSLVDFYLDRGADGLTILGVMGEAPKLTAAESRAFVTRVMARVAGRVPVIVGVSAPGLAPMRELAEAAMAAGAAGVMVAPVPSLRTNEQIVAYFEQVAQALGPDTPFVLQDYPLTTNVVMSPATIVEILRRCPTCVMVKHEDWPGLAKIGALRKASETGGLRRVSILVGNGGGVLPEGLQRGAGGAMTGLALPPKMIDVRRAHAAGDIERAHDIFDAYLPLARYEQQQGVGLAVRKYVLARHGAIRSAALRAPGPSLSGADIAEVKRLIRRQEARLAVLG